MVRYAVAILCFVSVFVLPAHSQGSKVPRLAIPAGTVLTFHLQTRLNPALGNEMDVLPKGTILKVRIVDGINSDVDRDGSEFRGEVVSPIVSENTTVLHPDAEVRGLLALLRSRIHPDGFRYELLITNVNDHGKSYDITASLNPSFADGRAASGAAAGSQSSR